MAPIQGFYATSSENSKRSQSIVKVKIGVARICWHHSKQFLRQQGLVTPLTPTRLCARCAPTLSLVLHKLFEVGGNRYLFRVVGRGSFYHRLGIAAP